MNAVNEWMQCVQSHHWARLPGAMCRGKRRAAPGVLALWINASAGRRSPTNLRRSAGNMFCGGEPGMSLCALGMPLSRCSPRAALCNPRSAPPFGAGFANNNHRSCEIHSLRSEGMHHTRRHRLGRIALRAFLQMNGSSVGNQTLR